MALLLNLLLTVEDLRDIERAMLVVALMPAVSVFVMLAWRLWPTSS